MFRAFYFSLPKGSSMSRFKTDSEQPNKPLIGWRERVALPELGIERITAKTDTGAFSSSIHAFNIESEQRDGETWVTFSVLPSRRDPDQVIHCQARVSDQRRVKSSDGSSSQRFFIRTVLAIGGQNLNIEISLADRGSMGYRMLLGRTALRGNFVVDPAASYLTSKGKSAPQNGAAK
jgi:hypothetical protein